MAKKVDPIRDKYYRPIETVEKCERMLFYISVVLSFTPFLIDKLKYQSLFNTSQVLFVMVVVLLMIISIVLKLFLFPKAQEHRYSDFISCAFGTNHYEQTKGYYNNNQTESLRRIAAQTLENSFYSKNTLKEMIFIERIKTGAYVFIWLILIINRHTDLNLITTLTQIVFSGYLLNRWVVLEWLSFKFEVIFTNLYELFNKKVSKTNFEIIALKMTGFYEMAKSNSGITLSEKIFNQKHKMMEKEWNKIKINLNI